MAIKTNIYKTFPKGSHRMPDGTIMKNKDMYKHPKKHKKIGTLAPLTKSQQHWLRHKELRHQRAPNNNPSTRGKELKTHK